MRISHFRNVAVAPLVVVLPGTLAVASPLRAQLAPEHRLGTSAIIAGTNGDDVLEGTPGDDVIVGLGGDDTIHGHGGDDFNCGGDGNDTIFGNASADTLEDR